MRDRWRRRVGECPTQGQGSCLIDGRRTDIECSCRTVGRLTDYARYSKVAMTRVARKEPTHGAKGSPGPQTLNPLLSPVPARGAGEGPEDAGGGAEVELRRQRELGAGRGHLEGAGLRAAHQGHHASPRLPADADRPLLHPLVPRQERLRDQQVGAGPEEPGRHAPHRHGRRGDQEAHRPYPEAGIHRRLEAAGGGTARLYGSRPRRLPGPARRLRRRPRRLLHEQSPNRADRQAAQPPRERRPHLPDGRRLPGGVLGGRRPHAQTPLRLSVLRDAVRQAVRDRSGRLGRAPAGEDAPARGTAPLARRRAPLPDAGPRPGGAHHSLPHARAAGVTLVEVIAAGTGEYRAPDPDGFREYVRTHKDRRLVSKLMSEQEAVSRFVKDGDYLAFDQNIPLP